MPVTRCRIEVNRVMCHRQTCRWGDSGRAAGPGEVSVIEVPMVRVCERGEVLGPGAGVSTRGDTHHVRNLSPVALEASPTFVSCPKCRLRLMIEFAKHFCSLT